MSPLEELTLCADRCGLRVVYSRQPIPATKEAGIIAFIPAGMDDDEPYIEQIKDLRRKLLGRQNDGHG